MSLHVLDHPLASHLVTHLRDRTTKPPTFRTLSYHLTLLLAIEATRDLPLAEKPIETPLEPALGRVLGHPLAVVAILRAGLAMVQPVMDAFPDVSVGYIGLERDEEARPRRYYCKLPRLEGHRVLVVDPMLATGGSAVHALELVRQHGGANPKLLCIVASPEGFAAVERAHPGTEVHAAALDRTLNAKKFILPGLGDFGDRLFGT